MFRKLKPLPATAPAIIVDGIRVPFEPGETVAAAMLRLTPPLAGMTRTKGLPRAPYCLMGACFECNALVAGIGMVRTCMQPARDGMQVDRSARSVRIANETE